LANSIRDLPGILEIDQLIAIDALSMSGVGKPLDPNAGSHRPRPVVMILESIEERSAVLNLAKLLKNQQKWKGVFVAEDLTKNQYALEKVRETSLMEEAARINLQSNNQGLKWRVVGDEGQGESS
jgi:hypothetical protein